MYRERLQDKSDAFVSLASIVPVKFIPKRVDLSEKCSEKRMRACVFDLHGKANGMLLRFAADRLSASVEKSDVQGVSAGANRV